LRADQHSGFEKLSSARYFQNIGSGQLRNSVNAAPLMAVERCDAFWILLSSLTPAQAQITAAIFRTVQDSSGAGVLDATVTVKSLETDTTRSVTTDGSGNFHIVSVPPGSQEVKAGKTCFKAAVRSGISLDVGQQASKSCRSTAAATTI
jgi:hypothetical protein